MPKLPAPTRLAMLETTEPFARAIADGFSELFEPEEIAVSAFEIASIEAAAMGHATFAPGREGAMGTLLPALDEPWRVELHFSEPPDEAAIRALIAGFAGADAAEALVFASIAAQDWVAASLEGLAPVKAGRFLVHGAHDRAAVKSNVIGIEIEAALAFGTGHHGTTRGCLLHFDALLKKKKPRAIVDIGTGTGVLAIGAAKALKRRIHAGEIDADSVMIARENARLNGVAPHLFPVRAAGFNHAALRGRRRYDVVFANILARPLRKLAPNIAKASKSGATLILSGLLERDVPGVLAIYRAQGFSLQKRLVLESWASLILRRGGASPRRL